MRLISLKGSGTYRLCPQCPGSPYAIPDSGARNPAVQRRAWVRLVVAIAAGVPLHHKSAFLNAVFPV